MALISRKILVLSGKGGVGKSSVAATVALQLAASGRKVGLLDCDFHGPSLPTILGVTHKKLDYSEENGIIPLPLGNLKFLSVGLLMEDPDQAIVWRGPVKMGVIKQLLEEVLWGELDDLIIDFPPGTGDEAISACQLVDCDKVGVIVTTPQEVALADCRKCIDFCNQIGLPLAGIVENMSGFVCPDCGKQHDIFSKGGGEALARHANVPLLAKLPLDPVFMDACDRGELAAGLEKSAAIKEAMEKIVSGIQATDFLRNMK
jgi:ATP-binding protein involved in chromosome partitioning